MRDLSLTEAAYGVRAGLFLIGYLLLQVPAGYLVKRIPRAHVPRRFAGRVGHCLHRDARDAKQDRVLRYAACDNICCVNLGVVDHMLRTYLIPNSHPIRTERQEP
ncbi:hypothetical protein LMG28727_05596 [Paraburkholderia kirstenboschensis]|nr:hypothetical protein LMG28727_05596 [Paraburkholderia kirstenboschensis]